MKKFKSRYYDQVNACGLFKISIHDSINFMRSPKDSKAVQQTLQDSKKLQDF